MTDQPPSSITTPTPSPERTGVQAPAHQVLGWLRVWLEIEPGAPWWMWLWRCFVLPPSPQRALRPWLLRPVRGLWAGLGWAIVRLYCLAMGGDFKVATSPGLGLKAILRLKSCA